jgi:hypothetical protein
MPGISEEPMLGCIDVLCKGGLNGNVRRIGGAAKTPVNRVNSLAALD